MVDPEVKTSQLTSIDFENFQININISSKTLYFILESVIEGNGTDGHWQRSRDQTSNGHLPGGPDDGQQVYIRTAQVIFIFHFCILLPVVDVSCQEGHEVATQYQNRTFPSKIKKQKGKSHLLHLTLTIMFIVVYSFFFFLVSLFHYNHLKISSSSPRSHPSPTDLST